MDNWLSIKSQGYSIGYPQQTTGNTGNPTNQFGNGNQTNTGQPPAPAWGYQAPTWGYPAPTWGYPAPTYGYSGGGFCCYNTQPTYNNNYPNYGGW